MVKFLSLLLLVSSLSGCALFTKKPEVITIAPVKVDPGVLEPCKDIPEWDGVDKVGHDARVLTLYVDCALRQQNSTKVIKSLANIKE